MIKVISSNSRSIESFSEEWFNIANEKHFWFLARFQVLQKLLKENQLLLGDKMKVLDIGCGTGVLQRQLMNVCNAKVTGCDLNIHSLKLNDTNNPTSDILFYDINEKNTQLKSNFNLILIFDVIEHLINPLEFVENAFYHLTDDGAVIINVPALKLLYSKYDLAVGHLTRYSKSEVYRIFNKDYKIQRCTYWGFLLLPIALIRKFLFKFNRKLDEKDIVKIGMKPPSELINKLLRKLISFEVNLLDFLPIGTSLMFIIKKR